MTKNEEKSNVVKLTPDEVKDLANIRSDFASITSMIGEVEINVKNLKMRKEELFNNLKKLSEKQTDINKKLENKYGNGSISLDTNEFTPKQE